jgi:N,N'-diacetyllegionaminate synthase
MNDFHSHISISGRRIGPGEPCYVIAEGGVSHLGKMEKARDLIDLASNAGADVFKTQHYKTNLLIGPSSPEWRERMRSKEMTDESIREMMDYCNKLHNIPFLCTPHDEYSLDFIDHDLDVPAFKIGSGEVENWSFLKNIASRGKPVILSTGMYEIKHIKEAIKVINDNGCNELAVLHCVTSYPAKPSIINLKVMDQIKDFFPGPVGYSDHSKNTAIPLAAVALGAQIIEKHITIDQDIPNAHDWKVSCNPDNFKKFISDIRDIESSIMVQKNKVSDIEKKSIEWARKSITARVNIPKSCIIDNKMLIMQRPGNGVTGSELNKVIGKKAKKNISKGCVIKLNDIS